MYRYFGWLDLKLLSSSSIYIASGDKALRNRYYGPTFTVAGSDSSSPHWMSVSNLPLMAGP